MRTYRIGQKIGLCEFISRCGTKVAVFLMFFKFFKFFQVCCAFTGVTVLIMDILDIIYKPQNLNEEKNSRPVQ